MYISYSLMDVNIQRLQVSSSNGDNQLCLCAANVFSKVLVKSLLHPLFTCFLSFEDSSTSWTNKTLAPSAAWLYTKLFYNCRVKCSWQALRHIQFLISFKPRSPLTSLRASLTRQAFLCLLKLYRTNKHRHRTMEHFLKANWFLQKTPEISQSSGGLTDLE